MGRYKIFYSFPLTATQYKKDADNNECYPRESDNHDDIILENRYAKDKNNNEYYPQKSSGKEFIINNVYTVDVQGKQSYPKDEHLNEYGHNNYITDSNNNQIYPKQKNNGQVAINSKYAQDSNQNEIYPVNQSGDQYYVGNSYAKKQNGDEFYAKTVNNIDIFIPGLYAKTSAGTQFYPKNRLGHEIPVSKSYAKRPTGEEIYPYLSGKEIQYAINGHYAKTSGTREDYPEYRDTNIPAGQLVIATDLGDPKFIAGSPLSWHNLHKKYADPITKTKYIIANGNNVGKFYISVMTGMNNDLYSKWKLKDPDLDNQFKIVSTKKYDNRYNIYQHINDQTLFFFKHTTKIFVEFDKKNKLHMYTLDGNKEKVYYAYEKHGTEITYKDTSKKIFQNWQGRNIFTVYDPNTIIYYEISGNDTQLFRENSAGRHNVQLLINTKIESQGLDTDGYIYSKTTNGEYITFENNKVIYFDFINKRKEKRRYNKNAAGNKVYFEWDGTNTKNIPSPTEQLNEESESEEDILIKPKSFITNFYIYIVIIFVIVGVLYWKFFFTAPTTSFNDRFK